MIHNYDARPKRIFIRLNRKKYRKRLDIMPTYEQIVSYVSNRRRTIGHNNDIEKLKDFIIKKFIYNSDETPDNKPFVFGCDYGVGTDDDHFHCGFTSIKLLQQMEEITENNGIFHFDCTYKIIKYNYPVMVFGFSDLAHKFLPIAFMTTSHETELDIQKLTL